MKKHFSFIIAAGLAAVFSAFTPEKPKTTTYYWLQEPSTWHEIDGEEVCTPGVTTNCVINVGGGPEQIYKTQSTSNPLKYN